jgi:peptidoglycan hydrolase-like protein with peptidoglycan-binding domain
MADERVRDVQKWLNQTYGKVSGYEKVTEDGVTSWATIYSLREGLQHELKITELGQGFGTATRAALRKVIKDIVPGTTGNIVKLIKGAFWCKGIGPTNFTDTFDSPLYNAIQTLQGYAGVTPDGLLSINLMAALFDMSAFVLISGRGDKRIREIQQELNGKYSSTGNKDDEGLGILPCDGIYQRDTNTALIYALQVVLKVKNPNGNYGPGTISATPIVNPGESGEIVRIIQYGLYVNGFYTGEFNANYDDDVASSVIAFRKFMNLPEFTGISDLTVIKGLLTSNGNTDRDSNMFDTSTQLTDQDVLNMKTYGFSIAGRYLTGTVGTGSEERDKNLTPEEIQRITDGGLSIFPIYEEGGYELKYFNGYQGYKDGFLAVAAARELGFPSGATIYFAVDVDVLDGDIEGTIAPYIIGVINSMADTEYSPGIYGTRNVCLHGEELGMKYSFVADMSYGWSGNLGFKMPKNWAFDQFVEYPIGGTPIDQGASSGKDPGHHTFKTRPIETISPEDAIKSITSDNDFINGKISFDTSTVLMEEPYIKITAKAATEFKHEGKGIAFSIKNGKFSVNEEAVLKAFLKENNVPSAAADVIIDKLKGSAIPSKLTTGSLTFEMSTSGLEALKMKITYNLIKVDNKTLSGECSMTLEVDLYPIDYVKEKVPEAIEGVVESTLKKLGPGLTIGIAVVIIVACFVVASPELLTAAIVTFLTAYIPQLLS